MYSHRTRTTVLWLAAVAILWAALAPSLSALTSRIAGKAWAEVCVAGGTKLVALDKASDQAAELTAPHAHCIFCVTQEDHAVAAPQAGWQMLATGPAANAPRFLIQPLHHVAANRNAHLSRAPPLHG